MESMAEVLNSVQREREALLFLQIELLGAVCINQLDLLESSLMDTTLQRLFAILISLGDTCAVRRLISASHDKIPNRLQGAVVLCIASPAMSSAQLCSGQQQPASKLSLPFASRNCLKRAITQDNVERQSFKCLHADLKPSNILASKESRLQYYMMHGSWLQLTRTLQDVHTLPGDRIQRLESMYGCDSGARLFAKPGTSHCPTRMDRLETLDFDHELLPTMSDPPTERILFNMEPAQHSMKIFLMYRHRARWRTGHSPVHGIRYT